jgi:hypothetical protein
MPVSVRSYPLIVIGMHRSGTSLVTQLLAQAGVHMGADRNSHEESDFFRELNKRVFRSAHADWDWPVAVEPALADVALRRNLVALLEQECRSKAARSYLGRRFGRADLASQDRAWGWKDPRNTCTLPLWLEVFPQARVVNVYRDGVDVAASLVARERKRAGRLDHEIRSSRCLQPEQAFQLWTEYLETSLRVTEDMDPDRVRDVRYERLIEKPETSVRELIQFAGFEPSAAQVASLLEEIDTEVGRLTRTEPEWIALRAEKCKHPLMQRLAYGDAP